MTGIRPSFLQNVAGWSWDFGDGAISADRSPSHIYSTEGDYNVNLVVSNANGTASKATTITVQSTSGGNGGESSSGGGGGGGAGGSPEPQSNVEAKELSQTFIATESPVKFDFPQKTTPVVYVSFDSKKTAGKTTTIAEMLKEKSTLVSGVPSDEVYKYLNIWVGNGGFANEKNIENAVVCFKVEKFWVQGKNIDKSTITLYMYSENTWNRLPTSLSNEDDKYIYLISETSGFSSFAITGKTAEQSGDTPKGKSEESSASVNLQSEKTEFAIGEDILLKLSAVNLITKPIMHVQVIIIPPSGMSVSSSEFAKSGAGQYTATFELEPGDGKDIEVRIAANQVGNLNVKGRVVYYFGENKKDVVDYPLDLPVQVSDSQSNQIPPPRTNPMPGLGIASLVLILVIVFILKPAFGR
jgi:PGF-pre-PGF domain-containing protein